MALGKQEGILLRLTEGARVWLTNVFRQQQSGGYWCWAACTSMVLQDLGCNLEQCDVAGQVLSGNCAKTAKTGPCYQGKALPCCDVVYRVEEIGDLWNKFCIHPVQVNHAVTWDDVWSELRAGNPVELFLGSSNEAGASGHLVLIIDAVKGTSGFRGVLIADPATDTHEASPAEFGALQERLRWGPWTWTWTNLRFNQEVE